MPNIQSVVTNRDWQSVSIRIEDRYLRKSFGLHRGEQQPISAPEGEVFGFAWKVGLEGVSAQEFSTYHCNKAYGQSIVLGSDCGQTPNRRGPGCFEFGTPIALPGDRLVAIENVLIGDTILSSFGIGGETRETKVLGISDEVSTDQVRLSFESDLDVVTSPDQPVVTQFGPVRARYLEEGAIAYPSGLRVTSVALVAGETRLRSLFVENGTTFYVGSGIAFQTYCKPGFCLAGDTHVSLGSDKTSPIREISAGVKVLSKNMRQKEGGEGFSEVLAVRKHTSDWSIEVHLSNGGRFVCSAD